MTIQTLLVKVSVWQGKQEMTLMKAVYSWITQEYTFKRGLLKLETSKSI